PDHGVGHLLQRYRVRQDRTTGTRDQDHAAGGLLEVAHPGRRGAGRGTRVGQLHQSTAGAAPVPRLGEGRVRCTAGHLEGDRTVRVTPGLREGIERAREFREYIQRDTPVRVDDDAARPCGRAGVLPDLLEVQATVGGRLTDV